VHLNGHWSQIRGLRLKRVRIDCRAHLNKQNLWRGQKRIKGLLKNRTRPPTKRTTRSRIGFSGVVSFCLNGFKISPLHRHASLAHIFEGSGVSPRAKKRNAITEKSGTRFETIFDNPASPTGQAKPRLYRIILQNFEGFRDLPFTPYDSRAEAAGGGSTGAGLSAADCGPRLTPEKTFTRRVSGSHDDLSKRSYHEISHRLRNAPSGLPTIRRNSLRAALVICPRSHSAGALTL